MGNAMKISVCFFIYLCVCIPHINGQNDLMENINDMTVNSVERTLLECAFDLMTGDHICDCDNRNVLFTLQAFSGNFNNVIIRNCQDLLVEQSTFRGVGVINRINFMNINHLSLESHSIAFERNKPIIKIQLKFSNVHIDHLDSYAIDGCIDVVTFDRCRIEKFSAYAMNTQCWSVYRISIENTEIVSIDMHAFKKLSIDHMILRNTTFQSHWPSRVFSSLAIKNQISISNCSFTTISSRAIDLDDVNDFIFADNRIDQFDAEAFSLQANGRIIIERNNFSRMSYSALSGIHLGENANHLKMEIQFLSNTIGSTDQPIRFETDRNLYLRILDLKFSKIINCNEVEKLKHNSFLPQYAELVYFKLDTDREYSSLSNIWSTKCTVTDYIITIILLALIAALILVCLLVGIFYHYMQKRPPTRPIPMIIPDGKTYRETQIMMQIEHADLLKTNL